MTSQTSARVTLWCSRIIALLILLLLLFFPALLGWYQRLRDLGPYGAGAILIGFYLCAPAVLCALGCIDRLIRNILAARVFILENVRCIRRIRWCCAWVSLVCLPAALFYPPLAFLSVIMAFLALVVSVVKNVMAAAVELREENDLTV